MEDKRKDPKEKKCAVCGKDMYAGEEWAYKRRDGKGKPKWFCSYKCMRAYDKKNEPKQTRPAGLPADLEAAAPKEKVSRAVLAKALAKEIKAGRSVIAYLTAEGYKNPYEAYNAVRHYCETKMPELAEVLKPLRDLPKGPQKKTGRPRKYPVTVEKVEDVPPVQCIQHVTPMEIEEAEQAVADLILQGGVNYQLKVDEAIEAQEAEVSGNKNGDFRFFPEIYLQNEILRIVDEAALECQENQDLITFSSSGAEAAMLQNTIRAAENAGVMKLRKQIRKKLGAEDNG